jgi:4-hydroxy-tetrahydrodipicolinate reductase
MAIRTLHVGLGPIGLAIALQAASRRGFQVAGAVDLDPSKVGRDLGALIGASRRLRVPVTGDLKAALSRVKPDVVVLCTSSSLRAIRPQLETILRARCSIVSTTEELAYPWRTHRRLASEIDRLARKSRAAVLGTGVNPGFVMDALPIMLTGVCERVDGLAIERVQDARHRRLPFQQKIGAGLTEAEFAARVEAGSVRHVGLTESIAMIGDALAWKLDRITDDIAPRVAATRVGSEHLTVEPGRVCGIVQDGVGYRDGRPVIRLHMEAYLGAPESYEAIEIAGHPNLRMRIPGGVHGDIATASVVVNSIPKVLAAPPGLHTMLTLPIPSWRAVSQGSARSTQGLS